MTNAELRRDAERIWRAGVDAVRPEPLVLGALQDAEIVSALAEAPRILVLGAGKAGGAMAAAVERGLTEHLTRLHGWVNIPEGTELPCQRIHLHPARPQGSNQPTAEGARGSEEILRLAREAGPKDVALCLLSGGGSALLPAPAPGLTLADKQAVTLLLHASGATIQEMNAVRKHLSAIKGGRLAEAFRGRRLFSLIISDVIGDPLDVIASGPTAPDPTTYSDALAVLDRFGLQKKSPAAVIDHLERGAAGKIAETPKRLPESVRHIIIGNNRTAYEAAWREAQALGYEARSLGQPIAGEASDAGRQAARAVRQARETGERGICFIGGGETTVTLTPSHGKGGRNQEWALAALCELGEAEWDGVVLMSGGTDGEDGPTDAAGAMIDAGTWRRAREKGLDAREFLHRHDAYPFFEATGDLLVTGLTNTNVMDLQIGLVADQGYPAEPSVHND